MGRVANFNTLAIPVLLTIKSKCSLSLNKCIPLYFFELWEKVLTGNTFHIEPMDLKVCSSTTFTFIFNYDF